MMKTKMKELFGKPRAKKDGTEGLVKDLPPIRDIQTDPSTYVIMCGARTYVRDNVLMYVCTLQCVDIRTILGYSYFVLCCFVLFYLLTFRTSSSTQHEEVRVEYALSSCTLIIFIELCLSHCCL